MGNEKISEVSLLLQLPQEVEHLGLYGYVHGADAFVADDELGLQRKGSCYAKALALSAGKFVRIA